MTVVIKLRLMESCGRVVTSHAFDEDQMASVTQRLFFMGGVAKSERSIFDRTNRT